MSSSVNVHPSTWTKKIRKANRLQVLVKTSEWPRSLKVNLRPGGDTIDSAHEYTVFIGSLSADAIRELSSDLRGASDKLFDYAKWLDEHGNDKLEIV